MKNKGVELLAPVNANTLIAAVQAGADAVYLGGALFGARQFAGNFDDDSLEKAIDYCHLRNVKVHLTLNTLVNNQELERLAAFAVFAANKGVDAFIVQDLGALKVLKEITDVPLHASTQMTIHNTEGARLAKKFGFSRIVLSREMTKHEIKDITDNVDIETEVFVHGALCMCYSGQCLMSSIIGGRSGNRGNCAQPCRLPYELYNGDKSLKKGYLLSPKDLSLAEDISELMKLGITSFKIEGRMKGPDYVASSVSIFKNAINQNRNASTEEMRLTKEAFSRDDFTKGFFGGDTGGAMMKTESGNDNIYKNQNTELLSSLKKFYDKNSNFIKSPLEMSIDIKKDEPMLGTIKSCGFESTCIGAVAQKAENKPTDIETVNRQMQKIGDYPFYIENLYTEIEADVFLSLKDLNDLRRNLLNSISRKICLSYKQENSNLFAPDYSSKKEITYSLSVSVQNKTQLEAVNHEDFEFVFLPVSLFEKTKSFENYVYVFPDVIKNRNVNYYYELMLKMKTVGITKMKTGNFAIISYGIKQNFQIFSSASLNIFNSQSAAFWNDIGVYGLQLSHELTLREVAEISKTTPYTGVMVYGRIPMMKIANCPVKSLTGKCDCENFDEYTLKDRKNEIFPIQRDKINCVTTLLNSKPLFMADKQDALRKSFVNSGLIVFTTEQKEQCECIINLCKKCQKYELPYTRGHFYRGVTT